MPHGRLETLRDCEDFVRGCLLMSTGGGGSPEWGMRMLSQALEDGLALEWTDVDDVPDDVWSATAYGMGSIAPVSQETTREMERLGLADRVDDDSMAEAVKELGDYVGRPIKCLVAAELGAFNTPAPLVTAARLGAMIADGDYAGRAVPDEMQGTPYLHGKHSWPFASVDRWGNVIITKYAVNTPMVERIGKMVAVASFGMTTMASTPLPAGEMKEIVVRGTLTKCLDIGRAMRQAEEKGSDPIDAALAVVGGWRLFEGVVTGKEWEDRDGYMFGITSIKGTGDYSGHTLRVWFKNENHVSWLDDKPWVCSPDLVTLVYRDGCRAATNTEIDSDDEVVAVGVKGLEAFRTDSGLNEASGPRYFGFDIDYVPIERLIEERPQA